MTHALVPNDIWSIILASEEAERGQPFAQRWPFRQRPQQYCSFAGKRSIFQQTLDRAELLSAPECRVTVVASEHYLEALLQVGIRRPGKLVAEPVYRDTAAAVFLGLAHVRACNPQATVVILPCDHFVYPEDLFVRAAGAGIGAATLLPDHLVLLAVRQDGTVPTHGSIRPGREFGSIANYSLRLVESFQQRTELRRTGFLNNTLILVAKAETLWKMGFCRFPEVMRRLEIYSDAIGTDREQDVLKDLYEAMPSLNFFAGLLQSSAQRAAVIEMNGVQWRDWRDLKRDTPSPRQPEQEARIA